jgi:hypothetical protein
VSDQIQWEIERADRRDHADRTAQPETEIPFAAWRSIQWDRLAVQTFRFLCRKRERADGAVRFGACVFEGLPGFCRDRSCHILYTFPQECGGFQ